MDLNKRVGFEVTVAFRNKLICKNCQVFPRLDVALFRCASCGQFLCQKCIGSVKSKCCPICQKSKAYFIRQTEIMEIVAGFKTHPCINLKNGCHEDIPAKDEELKSHDQSCVFQLVTCPTLDCDESIIFKNLVKNWIWDEVPSYWLHQNIYLTTYIYIFTPNFIII